MCLRVFKLELRGSELNLTLEYIYWLPLVVIIQFEKEIKSRANEILTDYIPSTTLNKPWPNKNFCSGPATHRLICFHVYRLGKVHKPTMQCLLIPEVVRNICLNLVHNRTSKSADPQYLGSLAALARTCHTISEPALDVLWHTQNSIAPLLHCTMPSDLWKVNKRQDSRHFLVRIGIYLFEVSRTAAHSKYCVGSLQTNCLYWLVQTEGLRQSYHDFRLYSSFFTTRV